jgi:mitochondrial fission protein ELM1
MKNKIIWVLTDFRVGTNSQSIGIAEKLGYKFETKKIEYNSFAGVPNFLKRASLIGIDKQKSDSLEAPYPDVIISAGRRLASVSAYIKKKSGGKTFAVHITRPNLPHSMFNMLVLPKHDGFKKDVGNIVTTVGSVNKINRKKMQEAGKKWKKELEKFPSPRIGVLLGGDTKSTKFSPKAFGKFAKTLSDIVNGSGGSLFVTTSRRTSAECVKELKDNLRCENYFYDWNLEDKLPEKKKNPLGNPYFAYMELSDFLVVTGDSMSMCSEACSTGKPVYIYASQQEIPAKHFRFCKSTVDSGYAKWFEFNLKKLKDYKYTPLNESQRVADIIKKEISKR